MLKSDTLYNSRKGDISGTIRYIYYSPYSRLSLRVCTYRIILSLTVWEGDLKDKVLKVPSRNLKRKVHLRIYYTYDDRIPRVRLSVTRHLDLNHS